MLNIILVNYNSSNDTINCCESIINNIGDKKYKIHIYDNNSMEDEVKILNNYLKNKNIDYYFSNINTGFAYANNYFMNKVKYGNFIWILNNDTLINKELINCIYNNLPEDNEICYMECRTFNNEFHDTGLHYVNLLSGKSKMKRTNKFDFLYICGASFVIKKTENMPLIDESYFLYYEDCDYGFKLKEKKYIYKKLNDCYFMHKIGSSSKNQRKKTNKLMLRSQVLFMKRYGICYPLYFIIKFILLISRRDIESLRKLFEYTLKIKNNVFYQ